MEIFREDPQKTDKKKQEKQSIIESTSKLNDPELTFTVSVTKEVQIEGAKTWIGASPQFFKRESTLQDALELTLHEINEFCRAKGAVTLIPSMAKQETAAPQQTPKMVQPKEVEEMGFKEKDLEALPKTAYKSGKGAWIFSREKDGQPSENPVIRQLEEKLRSVEYLTLFGKEYQLSGKARQFISINQPQKRRFQ